MADESMVGLNRRLRAHMDRYERAVSRERMCSAWMVLVGLISGAIGTVHLFCAAGERLGWTVASPFQSEIVVLIMLWMPLMMLSVFVAGMKKHRHQREIKWLRERIQKAEYENSPE